MTNCAALKQMLNYLDAVCGERIREAGARS